MALKAVVDTLDGIPAELQPLYAERDGKFHLDVEGFDDPVALKSALHKERSARSKAEQAARQLAERFQDVDLEEVKRLQEEERKRKDGELISAGKVEELVTERIKRQQSEFEKRMQAIEAEKTAANEQLNRLLIDNEVARIAASKGVAATAIDDVIWRARQTFRRDTEGTLRAYNGETQLYSGKDATQPLTIEEWLGDLAGRAPHLFAPSNGAPAQPTGSRGGMPHKSVREMTAAERAAFIAERGPQEWGKEYQKALAAERAARSRAH